MMTDDWRPSATVDTLKERARILQKIRAFFVARGVIEVETPLLSDAGNTDPQIESFQVLDPSLNQVMGWLHTSPEFAMKRLLASGMPDCYQIAKVFRSEERGRFHNPEFSMLEWYRLGFSADELMNEVEGLVRECLPGLEQAARLPYGEVFEAQTGLNPHTCPDRDLLDLLKDRQALPVGMGDGVRSDLLSVAFAELVEVALPRFAFVYDFPACQASLARLKSDGVAVADRFELYLQGMELANGFRELTDPNEQACRFQRETEQRQREGKPAVTGDGRFLDALRWGLPDCSGVALGVDRLVMLATGQDAIDGVIAFPSERA